MSLYKWPSYDQFWPFFWNMYVHLSQNWGSDWGSDSHFEVLNWSYFVQKLWLKTQIFPFIYCFFCFFVFSVITFIPIQLSHMLHPNTRAAYFESLASKLLRKAGRLQLIQNSPPSVAGMRQCCILIKI